jgi:large subunit ribosomal protein L9
VFETKVALHPEVSVSVKVNVARSPEEAEIQARTGRANIVVEGRGEPEGVEAALATAAAEPAPEAAEEAAPAAEEKPAKAAKKAKDKDAAKDDEAPKAEKKSKKKS